MKIWSISRIKGLIWENNGYQIYHSLGSKIRVSGCFAHARRRFEVALTPLKKDFTKEHLKETVAYQALTRIGILYKVEELSEEIKTKTKPKI